MNYKRYVILLIMLLLSLFVFILIFDNEKNGNSIVWFNLKKNISLYQDLEYDKYVAEFLSKDDKISKLASSDNFEFINLSLFFLKKVHIQNPQSNEIVPLELLSNYENALIMNLSIDVAERIGFFHLKLSAKANQCTIKKTYQDLHEDSIYLYLDNFVENVTNCLVNHIQGEKANFVFVGPDHGLSILTIKVAKKIDKNAKIGLFVFDEHVDIYDLEDENNLVTKANVFGKMLLEGYVDYVVFLGASDTAKSIVEESVSKNFTKNHIFNQMSVYSDADLINQNTESVISNEISKMQQSGITNVMISVDIDVLPSHYTGFEYSILAPSIGQILRFKKNYSDEVLAEIPEGFSKGFEPKELSKHVKAIKYYTLRNEMEFGVSRGRIKILGDVQELLPKQDLNNTTTYAAAQIVTSFFG